MMNVINTMNIHLVALSHSFVDFMSKDLSATFSFWPNFNVFLNIKVVC